MAIKILINLPKPLKHSQTQRGKNAGDYVVSEYIEAETSNVANVWGAPDPRRPFFMFPGVRCSE
jgi:hypothetical protein